MRECSKKFCISAMNIWNDTNEYHKMIEKNKNIKDFHKNFEKLKRIILRVGACYLQRSFGTQTSDFPKSTMV
jgi:hypothetical protein